jgi:hypothetical protein
MEKTNHIDHMPIDRQRHSCILDVCSFKQQIVILKTVWWWQKLCRLAESKQRLYSFPMEMLNLKKLNEVEGKEKYRFEDSNRFAALEDLDAEWKLILLGKQRKYQHFSLR